jgi:hypothetical protein
VGVRSSKLLETERYGARGLSDLAAGAGFSPAATWRLLARLLGLLGGLERGRYLLVHAPGSLTISLYAASPHDSEEQQVWLSPAPCVK